MNAPTAKSSKKSGKIWLIIGALALVLAIVFFSLPLYSFSAPLLTKKSANTDIGSEKYIAARAEVEAAAAAYPNATITEDVTQRTNSKGVTSTLVVFTVTLAQKCTGWDFITRGLPGSALLWVLLIGCVAALVAAGVSFLSSGASFQKAFRTVTVALLIVAIVMIPVFVMRVNYVVNRQLWLDVQDGLEDATERLTAFTDGVFGKGTLDADAASSLKSIPFQALWPNLALAAALVLALLCAVWLLKGEMARPVRRGLLYLFILIVCIVILYPYYVMLVTGFRTAAETNDMYFRSIFPTTWIWSNLRDIVDRGVLTYIRNSVLISSVATIIALVCGIPAAYAMARMRFKGKKIFLGFVIMSQMFSPVVLLVGISQLMMTLNLNDTLLGLMFINAAFNQAFAIWLLRGTFVSISSEMEQAACIDGCNTVQALLRILLPMAAPGIVTTLIFIFINAWNEYTISTVLISTPANKPITVGITQFSSYNMIEWQYLFAASLLATIPVIILFMCIEKHLVAGLTSGGVKG